jgi:hypothetical protein
MAALIPHPLYRVYEKFITGKLSRHDQGNSYSLSLWERVRVRASERCARLPSPSPPALSRGAEGAR